MRSILEKIRSMVLFEKKLYGGEVARKRLASSPEDFGKLHFRRTKYVTFPGSELLFPPLLEA